jgi:mono/diheme cytochrome c family protein
MKKKITAIVKLKLGLATVMLMGACVSNPDSSGLEYMPDMYRSPAIEPYVDYGQLRNVEDAEKTMKQSALTPPLNVIPYIGADETDVLMSLPYFRKPNITFKTTHGLVGYEFTNEDTYALAKNDKNPLILTVENSEAIMKRGKYLYSSKCMHCHGEKGDGNGPMMLSGAYSGVPDYKTRPDLGDGQIFYSIYYGLNSMGAHGSFLKKKDIWTLVHYVRQFQNADYGKFNADGSVAAVAAPDTTVTQE